MRLPEHASIASTGWRNLETLNPEGTPMLTAASINAQFVQYGMPGSCMPRLPFPCPPWGTKSDMQSHIDPRTKNVEIDTDNWKITYNHNSQTMEVRDLKGNLYVATQGDPHLRDKDGNAVGDFYRDGQLSLPDGTQVYLDTKNSRGEDWKPGDGPSWVNDISVMSPRQGLITVNNVKDNPTQGINLPPGFYADAAMQQIAGETHERFVVGDRGTSGSNIFTGDWDPTRNNWKKVSQATIDAGESLEGPGISNTLQNMGIDFLGMGGPMTPEHHHCNRDRFDFIERLLQQMMNSDDCPDSCCMPALCRRPTDQPGESRFELMMLRFLLRQTGGMGGMGRGQPFPL